MGALALNKHEHARGVLNLGIVGTYYGTVHNYSHPLGTMMDVSVSSPGTRVVVVAVLCRVSRTALLGLSARLAAEETCTIVNVLPRRPCSLE